MRYAARLAIGLLGLLFLLALTGDHISDSLTGETIVGVGATSATVRLVLDVVNVREHVTIAARCRARSPSGEDLKAEIGGVGDVGASEGGVATLALPAGEHVKLPFTVTCHLPGEQREASVHWEVESRARPPGGCTPAAIIGRTPAVSISHQQQLP